MGSKNMKTPKDIEEKIVNDYINNHEGSHILSKRYKLHSSTICSILKRNNVSMRNNRDKSIRYRCNEHFFDVIDTEEKAYWLGFILADGYVSVQKQCVLGISLKKSDCVHLEKFKESIKSEHPIREYISSGFSNSHYCRILITSPLLVRQLISLGVIEHKTNIVRPPHGIPDELISHCMRGYFDGNGSISVSRSSSVNRLSYRFRLCSTDDILIWFNNYFRSHGINVKDNFSKRKPHQIVSQSEIGGNLKAQKVLDLLYENSHVYLERKYQRYQDLCKLNTVLPIRKNRVKELQIEETSLVDDNPQPSLLL